MVTQIQGQTESRLLSLDFYRGLTMFLLIAEFSRLFTYMVSPEIEGSLVSLVGQQFHHAKWEGMRFWDLIQPFFMFIVGVVMPLSFSRRLAKGDSLALVRKHAFVRAFLMFFWAGHYTALNRGK